MLNGTGIWIKNISQCENGDWDQIIAKAKECGIGWIAVKSGDVYRLNQWQRGAAQAAIQLCHEAGLQVFTWHPSRPRQWSAEVHQILENFEDGADGHVIIVDNEWRGQSIEAELFVRVLRLKNKFGKPIAYAPIVDSVSDFVGSRAVPIASFAKVCDIAMPHMYIGEGGKYERVRSVTDEVFATLAKNHPDAVRPLCPVLVEGSIEQTAQFLHNYKEDCSPSVYCWEKMPNDMFAVWAKLHHSGVLKPEEVTPEETDQVVTDDNNSVE